MKWYANLALRTHSVLFSLSLSLSLFLSLSLSLSLSHTHTHTHTPLPPSSLQQCSLAACTLNSLSSRFLATRDFPLHLFPCHATGSIHRHHTHFLSVHPRYSSPSGHAEAKSRQRSFCWVITLEVATPTKRHHQRVSRRRLPDGATPTWGRGGATQH